jgi:hypothetical protein
LPAKKQTLQAKLKSWQLTAVVISSISLIAGGVGVFAYQQYTQAQISAAAAAEEAIVLGEQRIDEISDRIDDLELAIRNSEQTVVNTDGQTLDDKEREDLLAEIETSKEIWVAQKTKLLELEAAVKALKTQLASGTSPRETLGLLIGNISEVANSDWMPIVTQIVALGEKIKSVQTAQSEWKKEQEIISAKKEEEEAERVAAEKAEIERAAAEALAKQATEITAVAAPPASSASVPDSSEPDPLKSSVESYILALATNVTFVWDPDLCEPGFVCGVAAPNVLWTGTYSGPPRTAEDANVFIFLDDSFVEFYYTTRVGQSILVHEAAHARQWLKYGTEIRTANEGYTGLIGDPAVEYMADCATIVKLGYSTNVYTSTCTTSELEAAATIW